MKAAGRCIRRRWAKPSPNRAASSISGVTFDGDADRALFCDAQGRVVNGDGVLLLTARDLQSSWKVIGEHCRRNHDVEHGS